MTRRNFPGFKAPDSRALRCRAALLAALLLGFQALGASQDPGQSAARPDRGMVPPGSYLISDMENISLTNGNVYLSIPLASLPPIAGGRLTWTVSAVYNSKLWDVIRIEQPAEEPWPAYVVPSPQVSQEAGWIVGGIYSLYYRESHQDYNWILNTTDPDYQSLVGKQWYKVYLTTPDGATHELRPLEPQYYHPYSGTREYLIGYYDCTPESIGHTMSYYSYDGSYIWAVVEADGDWTAYFRDGKRIENVNGDERVFDTNGNSILITTTWDVPTGQELRRFIDEQTGREIQLISFTQATPFRQELKYAAGGGAVKTIDITWGGTDVDFLHYIFNPSCAASPSGSPMPNNNEHIYAGLSVIRTIELPQSEPAEGSYNGRLKYQFSYNSDTHENQSYQGCPEIPGNPFQPLYASLGMGQLQEMTIPSGAKVAYSFSLDSLQPLARIENTDDLARESVTEKTVTFQRWPDLVQETQIWTYAMTGSVAHVFNPDGSFIHQDSGPHDLGFKYSGGIGSLAYRINYSDKRIVERHWTCMTFDVIPGSVPPEFNTINPAVDYEYITLKESGAAVTMSAKAIQNDFNGNITQEIHYDWLEPDSLGRDSQNVPIFAPPDDKYKIRTINRVYYNPASTSNSSNVYAKREIGPATPLILNAEQSVTIGPKVTQYSYDGLAYGSPPTKGNLTREKRYDNLHGKWIWADHQYDGYGNRTHSWDFKGNLTSLGFNDATHALPTSVTVDPGTGTGTQTSYTSYDYSTGRVTSQTDPNGNTITTSYTNQLLGGADAFARPGLVTSPPVGGEARQVLTKYHDAAGQTEVWSDLDESGVRKLKSRTTLDQLMRPVLSETSENGSTYGIQTQTLYANLGSGQVIRASNPSRSTGESTDGWTRTTKDVLGRVIEVAAFSGVTIPPLTGTNANWTGSVGTVYYASQTTVVDQAGKMRQSIADAAGRIVQMIEDPDDLELQTIYSYDALDNLTGVIQGVQARTFTYDSLGRLTSAVNPESGTVTFDYDDNGNLKTKTDIRGTITHTYDGINRLLTRTYTDATPPVTYTYDQDLQTTPADPNVNSPVGRLSGVSSSVSSTVYRYDAMGRIQASMQTTDASPFRFLYAYNLAGGMLSQTYPSGRVVAYGYDAAGRLLTVSSGGTNYASNTQYAAHGALARLQLGNGLVEQTCFNGRLQPVVIRLRPLAAGCGQAFDGNDRVHLSYSYGDPGNNNGNVISQTISLPGLSLLQNYSYDALNRLSSFAEPGGWSQTYDYDRYGNRSVTGSVPNQTLTPQSFDPNTNKITGGLWSYQDSGLETGNLTSDGAGNVMSFNLDNLLRSFNGAGYQYDGEGRRVKKTALGVTTVFVYNGLGQLAAEYGTSAEPAGPSYLTADHLGSTRLITDQNQQIKARFDYLPFGEEIPAGVAGRTTQMGYSASDQTSQRFSGKERDAESGLDYFGARYFSGAQGRFTSPDTPLLSQLGNPQMWNLYAYTANNPLRRVDPDGRNWFDVNGKWTWYEGSDVDASGKACKPGTTGCRHSDYANLIVFQKTGTNKYGATIGTLTLYGKGYDDVIAKSQAFSGGVPGKGPIPEGTFTIRLDIRDTVDPSDLRQIAGGAELKPFYGIQQTPADVGGYDVRWEWGAIRAALNEARGETRSQFLGNYLHGKNRPGDYTHGCIAERSEQILKLLLQMDPKVTRAIPVDVRRK